MNTYKLTNENIDMISEKISEEYSKVISDNKEILRAKLLLEEALLKYQAKFGEEVEFYFRVVKILQQVRFIVRVRADSFDPFSLKESPMAKMVENLLSSFEKTAPSWKFKNFENEIVFVVKKKKKINAIYKILIASSISAIIGVLIRLFLPLPIFNEIVTSYFAPLSNAYAGLFCIMAVLLTFFAIVLSIVRVGDIAVAGALGGKIMRRFYVISLILVIAVTIPIVPFLDLSNKVNLSITAKSIYDVIIGFIPSNIVSPFLEFNSIHIMIVGAMFGFALLFLGNKGDNLVKVFDECNLVAIVVNGFLNKFIVIYVAMKIFELIITSELSVLWLAGKLVAIIFIGQLLFFVFYSFRVCYKTKIKFKKYFNTMITPFLICLSSANFGAAFSSCVDSLISLDSFKEKGTLSFNIGSVAFRPACTLVYVFSSIYLALSYGVEMSITWVITAIVLSIILVAAVPNIPGVSVAVITLLFAQLGLPNETVSLMIAINAPLQFVTVAVDTWCLLGETVCISKQN